MTGGGRIAINGGLFVSGPSKVGNKTEGVKGHKKGEGEKLVVGVKGFKVTERGISGVLGRNAWTRKPYKNSKGWAYQLPKQSTMGVWKI